MVAKNEVVGAAADGAAKSGNPVLVAGQDGTNAQSLKTDTTGRVEVIGGAADGAAVAGNPVLVGGSDGTNAQSLLVDTSGRAAVVGAAADGAAVAGNPVLIGGTDGTNAQSAKATTGGQLVLAAPQEWTATHAPAVNTQAVATKAAGAAGTKHVVTWICLGVCGDATGDVEDGLQFDLVEDVAGTPAILASFRVGMAAGAGNQGGIVNVAGLNIVCTADKSITLQSAAAPETNSFAFVTVGGYTLPS